MHITAFSILTTLIWVSIFAMILTFLRKHMFLKYFSIYPLLVILFACLLRLLFSFELPFAKVIASEEFLPSLRRILNQPLLIMGNDKAIVTPAIILLFIWIVTAIKIFFSKIWKYYQLYRLLHFLPACEDKRLQDLLLQVQDSSRIRKPVKIVVNKEVKSPAIVGVLSPVIILPDTTFTDDELLGIFFHEWTHYCYRHAIIKLIGEIIQSIFWWNPLLKNLTSDIEFILEIHADTKVSKFLNKQQRSSYLNAILKVVSTLNGTEKKHTLICSFVEKKEVNMLTQRFGLFLNNKDSNKKKKKILYLFY